MDIGVIKNIDIGIYPKKSNIKKISNIQNINIKKISEIEISNIEQILGIE